MNLPRRAFVALLSALAMLASLGPIADARPDRLEQIENQIERKRELIRAAEEERQGVLSELEASDHRRAELADQVTALGAQLDEARGRLELVEARLNAARDALDHWGARLDEARARLDEQQQTLEERAAIAYKLGPAGYLSFLLGADDLSSLVDRSVYLRNVLTIDSNMVDGLEVTRSLVGDHESTVEDYEQNVTAQQRRVEKEIARVEELRAEEQAARAAVLEQIDYQRELIGEIQETKARYEAAVADMQAESDQIRGALQSSGSSGSGNPGGQFFWPTSGSIGSGFGWRTHPIFGTQRFHSGVDIGGSCGQPIWAADDGTVISASYNDGYGNATVIDHGGGLATLYAHQSSFSVSSGQSVDRGQTIGAVGTTGWSTGCHLHFEVRVNGTPVDPVPYLT
jgi:murein DD-endopeptidase MepM/ murein hydrolase activator NlpD